MYIHIYIFFCFHSPPNGMKENLKYDTATIFQCSKITLYFGPIPCPLPPSSCCFAHYNLHRRFFTSCNRVRFERALLVTQESARVLFETLLNIELNNRSTHYKSPHYARVLDISFFFPFLVVVLE